jgi:hypothetical protein
MNQEKRVFDYILITARYDVHVQTLEASSPSEQLQEKASILASEFNFDLVTK